MSSDLINGKLRKRLRSVAWAVLVLASMGVIASLSSAILPLLAASHNYSVVRYGLLISLDRAPTDIGSDALVAWVWLLPHSLTIISLWQLILLSRNIATRQIISHAISRYLFRFALFMFLAELSVILMPLIEASLIDLTGPHFDGSLNFNLEGNNFFVLFVSVLLVLVAWMFDAATAYVEDSDSIV